MLMANSMLQGIAIGVIWVPLTIATFATLETRPISPRARRCLHLLRNIGSSFFISICVAEIVRATGANYSRMTEMVDPYNRSLSAALGDGRLGHRDGRGAGRLSKEIDRQAAMMGYINAFGLYTLCLGDGDSADPAGGRPIARALVSQSSCGLRGQETLETKTSDTVLGSPEFSDTRLCILPHIRHAVTRVVAAFHVGGKRQWRPPGFCPLTSVARLSGTRWGKQGRPVLPPVHTGRGRGMPLRKLYAATCAALQPHDAGVVGRGSKMAQLPARSSHEFHGFRIDT